MTERPETLRPLHDQLLVTVEEQGDRTKGGLYIPDAARRGEVGIGTVVAVGPGRVDPKTGKRSEVELAPGDRIAYEVFRAVNKAEREVDGVLERLAVIEHRHVLGVLEGEGEIEVNA